MILFSCLLHPIHIQAWHIIARVDPWQGPAIAAMKASPLITAACPGRTPILEGVVIPLQSPGGGTTTKEQPIHKRAMDSNLGMVATQNMMNLVIPEMANICLTRRSLSLLVRYSLPRGSRPTWSVYILEFFFIYCRIFLHSTTADVGRLHSRAHSILQYLGPFIHIQ